MNLLTKLAGLAIGTCLLLSANAQAQTQAVSDRANELARYVVTVPFCQKFGYVLAPNGGQGMSEAASNELLSRGMEEQAMTATVSRQVRSIKLDLDANLENTPNEPGPLYALFDQIGETCEAARRDPTISKFLSVPAGFDPKQATHDAADKLLARGGLASWQTPTTVARGDLLMTAGACRKQIGGPRTDALFKAYARSTNARERAYYEQAYDDGLEDTEMDLDLTQCERALASLKKKAGVPN